MMSISAFIADHTPAIVSGAILGIPALVHGVIAESGVQAPAWLGSLTQISAFGLVAWIVFHMFSTWLPKQQEEHARQLKDQRDAHALATDTIAKAHAEAMKEISTAFKESLQQQRQDLLALRFVCHSAPFKTEEFSKKS